MILSVINSEELLNNNNYYWLWKYFINFLIIIGFISFINYLYNNCKSPFLILKAIFLQYFYPESQLSLKERYGEWAVITGATDGIGKAYAKELAKKGLNIVLISRSLEKLAATAKEIENEYSVKTKTIQADFSSGKSIYDHIKTELIDMKIGILVNNVGQMYDYPDLFINVPENKIWDMVLLNIGATVMMTRLILPQMKCNNKGAVVNIASITEIAPGPYYAIYAASKVFVKYFTIALQWELKSMTNLTIQLLHPGFIATNMTKFSEDLKTTGFFVADLQNFVQSAVFTLGKTDITSGTFYHGIHFAASGLAPSKLITYITIKIAKMWNRQQRKPK